jgi:hypothetical protein
LFEFVKAGTSVFLGVGWLKCSLELGLELILLLIIGEVEDLWADHSPPSGCMVLKEGSGESDLFSIRDVEGVIVFFYLENPGIEGIALLSCIYRRTFWFPGTGRGSCWYRDKGWVRLSGLGFEGF